MVEALDTRDDRDDFDEDELLVDLVVNLNMVVWKIADGSDL